MLIPLIEKDEDRNDFTCRDGEIDFILDLQDAEPTDPDSGDANTGTMGTTSSFSPFSPFAPPAVRLTPTGTYPTATVRIPLQKGDREKAALLLDGEISRVDPETADRLTQAMLQKAAECLLDLSTDYRRQGLFILPLRVYTMTMTPDGPLSFPSPQAVALPADFPPHPEITAAAATDDCLTLALRFPVRPHRLSTIPPPGMPQGYSLRTFISYPLYIPDPKEMRGSIGSVRSATGANATGLRFAFLSTSAIKASVAAPEKYHELVGNERTGYRVASKAAAEPDYSCYAKAYGYVAPFPADSLLAPGEGADTATDPLDWIADWNKSGEGYLPASLPYKYRLIDGDGDPSRPGQSAWPDGIDAEETKATAESLGLPWMLMTRPMMFAGDAASRRHAEPTALETMQVLGLPDGSNAHAILYGSDDCVHWQPLRRFDPRLPSRLLTPRRLFWRLLLFLRPEARRRGGVDLCILV